MSLSPRTRIPGTVVRSDLDLFELWQQLIGEPGFGRRSLWLVFFDHESRVSPVIVPIDDVPDEPDPLLLSNFAAAVRALVASQDLASVAPLLSRPGPGSMQPSDRRWAGAVRQAFGSLSPWPVHLATSQGILVFAVDDLLAS